MCQPVICETLGTDPLVSSTIKRFPKMNWMEAAGEVGTKGLFWVFEGARMSRHIITLFMSAIISIGRVLLFWEFVAYQSPHFALMSCLWSGLLSVSSPHVSLIGLVHRLGIASSPRSGCSVFTTDISVVIYYRLCGCLAQSRKSSSSNFLNHHRTIHPENKSFPSAIYFFYSFHNQFPGFRSLIIARR